MAPVIRANGDTVLKLRRPHTEAEHEVQGLAFWLEFPQCDSLTSDEDLGAILMERCEPGTPLRAMPEPQQDRGDRRLASAALAHAVITTSVSAIIRHAEALERRRHWPTFTVGRMKGLVREGLSLFEELSRTAPVEVLLATDLHAGNVLQSQREPWLVIDPKPFVGDPAYDATQHLFNCDARLRADPNGTIRRMADLLRVDHERVRLWTFARAAAEPREDWKDCRLAAGRALSRQVLTATQIPCVAVYRINFDLTI